MSPSRTQHRRRASALAALVASVTLGVAGCTVGDATAGPATTHAVGQEAGGTTGPSAAGSDGASTGTGSGSGTGSGTGPGTGPTAGHGSGSTGTDPQPVPTASDPGTEIIPTATPTPYRLPGLTSSTKPRVAPLVAKAPKTAAAHGRVVAGFPTNAVPLPGLTIVSSSVASQGRHVQVTVQASSPSSPKTVRTRLTSAFTKLGYTASTAAAAPGASAVEYTHGTDGVVVTLRPRLGGGTELTLTGAFTTAG
jgi:hypothetical protein